jgi:hypothetical protein
MNSNPKIRTTFEAEAETTNDCIAEQGAVNLNATAPCSSLYYPNCTPLQILPDSTCNVMALATSELDYISDKLAI